MKTTPSLPSASALVLLGFFWAASALMAAGCGQESESGTGSSQAEPQEDEATPEERVFLAAGRPFADAIAARKYSDAYALLSSHARARMSINQFAPDDNNKRFKQNEVQPLTDVSAETFADLMLRAEERYGTPSAADHLSVFSTDPDTLARRHKEKLDALDSMFAIGAMPDSVPTAIRRASLRGHITTQLSPGQLAETAKAYGMTVAALREDPDFRPYFTLKMVLVEEDGGLKVGYFEMLPPSMMD